MIFAGFPFSTRLFWWLVGAKFLALLFLIMLSASKKEECPEEGV